MVPVSRQLGQFEIQRKLGRGGMADVYLAQDSQRGCLVALKLIEHSADSDTCETIEAERRGAALQARLAEVDGCVVRIYDVGDLDGYFYVSMEYVPGQDLTELLRAGALAPERACQIALAVCETLSHAHSLEITIDGKPYHGIVHGDIKPKNIRVDPQGDVRVLDFGIAKALSLSRRLTRNEFGSVPYASPERLDQGEVDAHSDLWSLGVMLYEMATGLQPYHSESTERLESMIRSRIPPPPAPDPCPEPLRRILHQALAPEVERRYAAAEALAADLKAFVEGQPVQAPEIDLDRDATRRTTRQVADDSDETRRTRRPVGSAAAALPIAPVPTPYTTRRRVVVSILLVLLGWFLFTVGSDFLLYRKGQQLESDINAEHVTDPDRIWDRWTELSRGRPSSVWLWGPRRAVKRDMLREADRVIDTYRLNDAQRVNDTDWEHARVMLTRVLEIDPGDESVHGKLRLAEGHLARIQGTARKNATLLNQAVSKFNEAQGLLPKLPDPQLGLARLYVYGLKDIDKAYDALHEAERRGYKLGNREKSQLADGYRDRADRLFWDSRSVRGLPQEKDQLHRVADDYHRALEIYQEVAPYGGASSSIARVQKSQESVEERVKQIEEGGALGGNPK